MIFKLKNRWTKLTLGGLFVGALIGGLICAYLGFKAGVDLTLEGEVEKEIATLSTDQLTLLPELNPTETRKGFNVKSNGRNGLMKITDQEIQMYGIELLYRESKDSLFHVYQNLSARAKSNSKGVIRAENIDHSLRMVGDSLFLDTDYRFPREDKIRDQRVLIIIEIPEGGSVLTEGREIAFTEYKECDDDEVRLSRRGRRYKYGRFFGDGYYENHRHHW